MRPSFRGWPSDKGRTGLFLHYSILYYLAGIINYELFEESDEHLREVCKRESPIGGIICGNRINKSTAVVLKNCILLSSQTTLLKP